MHTSNQNSYEVLQINDLLFNFNFWDKFFKTKRRLCLKILNIYLLDIGNIHSNSFQNIL